MEDTQTPPLPGTSIISWSAPMHATHQRSHRWYVIAGVAVVAGAAYGILTGSWPFAIVIVLCGAMYFLLREHVHPDETITLNEFGVSLRGKFLRWEDLRGYWLLQTKEYTEVHFTPKNPRITELTIQTGTQDVSALKTLLNALVPELTDQHESLIDIFIRICKL